MENWEAAPAANTLLLSVSPSSFHPPVHLLVTVAVVAASHVV